MAVAWNARGAFTYTVNDSVDYASAGALSICCKKRKRHIGRPSIGFERLPSGRCSQSSTDEQTVLREPWFMGTKRAAQRWKVAQEVMVVLQA
jgi:hypothetical protein